MKQRKSFRVIDRHLQLKTTFSIIGFILISFIVLIATTTIFLSDNNRRILSITEEMMDAVGELAGSEIREARGAALKAGRSRAVTLGGKIEEIQSEVRKNRIVITNLVLLAVVLGIVLSFYLINATHRISGPIYVLSNYIREVMSGRRPDVRSLRKNDEFKEFYAQFVEMLDFFYGKKDE